MAIFLAASDESCGGGIFHYAGYIAPEPLWSNVLVPAWEKEVLNCPPLIDEFHVVDLRSRQWRDNNGLTKKDAEERIDRACSLVERMEKFCAIRSSVDVSHYATSSDGFRFRLNDPKRSPLDLAVDVPAFLVYVTQVLNFVCVTAPGAEKVDFVIEKKREVFASIHDFYEGLREVFVTAGLPHFSKMMGELLPSDKKRIPLQAADLLCWHAQRYVAHLRNKEVSFSETDRRRMKKITKYGFGVSLPRDTIETLFKGLFSDWSKLNEL